MEIVISDSGVTDLSDENVDLHSSDDLDGNKKEAEETAEKLMESEGLELSIAEVSSVILSNSVGEKGDDVKESLGENAPQVQIEAKQQERVKCPFCDKYFVPTSILKHLSQSKKCKPLSSPDLQAYLKDISIAYSEKKNP